MGKSKHRKTNCLKGCSHMTSVKNGEVQTPPPPLVRKHQKRAYPPYPPCQKSDFDVSIFLKENILLKKNYAYEYYLHIWKERKNMRNTSLD